MDFLNQLETNVLLIHTPHKLFLIRPYAEELLAKANTKTNNNNNIDKTTALKPRIFYILG